jgi:NADH:ubiquinone oxidoreductase subunit E
MKTINVCIGSACHIKGAYKVINKFLKIVEERKLEDLVVVKAAFCLGECTKAVSVKIDEGKIHSLKEQDVEAFIDKYIL